MDTSETYVKMRLKATPYLGRGIPIECPCNLIVDDVWVDSKGNWYYSTEVATIQLERQDQLQEMLNKNMNHVVKQNGIVDCLYFQDLTQMMSMSWEQLWLAFVMKVKYGKIWNKEKWMPDGKSVSQPAASSLFEAGADAMLKALKEQPDNRGANVLYVSELDDSSTIRHNPHRKGWLVFIPDEKES